MESKRHRLTEPQSTTLRHLAAARFHLPETLPTGEAQAASDEAQHFLHHFEFELALSAAIDLGSLIESPADYWRELLLAAETMGLDRHAEQIRARMHV